MKLLAVDTVSDACSVALWQDGEVLERVVGGRRHAELLFTMIEEVLAQAGVSRTALDVLAFDRGPGSFTGVRIGVAAIQGIAYGADLPVVGLSSLITLASACDADQVVAAIDARMDEVYVAHCVRGDGSWTCIGAERVCAPGQVPVPPAGRWHGVGSGWDAWHIPLKKRLGDRVEHWTPGRVPGARHLAALAAEEFRAGRAVDAIDATPAYLRDRVVRPPSG